MTTLLTPRKRIKSIEIDCDDASGTKSTFKTDKYSLDDQASSVADTWESATRNMSATWQIRESGEFRKLIDFGEYIIPLAIKRLRSNVKWHFVLLKVVKRPPSFVSAKHEPSKIKAIWARWHHADNG